MKFSCWITKEEVVAPCPVKTCMWGSCNEQGCMAVPEPPNLENMSDTTMAKHKGLTVQGLADARLQAQQRIKSLLIIGEYLDWCHGKVPPWRNSYVHPDVANLVKDLSNNRWPYNIHELEWRTRHIAFTLHKPSVDRFQAHVGKQVDWLSVLELSAEQVLSMVLIFKRSSKAK